MSFDEFTHSAEFRHALADADTVRRVRRQLIERHPTSGSWSDAQVLRVYFAERERWPHMSASPQRSTPRAASPAPPAPAPAPAKASNAGPYATATATTVPAAAPAPAPAPAAEKTWIEIQLVGEDDQPIAGEEYEITLSNGLKFSGTLNAEGMARLEGLDPDTCQVTFPKLDKAAWSPLG
ncbi:hypothetical protein SAMN02745857_00942 [Andreprevotia lacus DSM 23236]|jgi:hypothetical protein|uniref:Uncharacterized protein n=1 Tax=Andreprevotia lacus DSM 23236 TaxID=1121001 RepID=A0A1W1X997_9NEIS|nr:hypothetical protein [Andreprevotia lacus]SMC20413.1 hypothetical protein SAMN02745857_00942 [Andreprevotia lacus DSM 23236]